MKSLICDDHEQVSETLVVTELRRVARPSAPLNGFRVLGKIAFTFVQGQSMGVLGVTKTVLEVHLGDAALVPLTSRSIAVGFELPMSCNQTWRRP